MAPIPYVWGMAPRSTAKVAEAATTTQEDLIAAVNKQFGPGSLSVASSADFQVRRWPTGVLPIDILLDGGIPAGRMLEVYGPYSTLKSYVLYKAFASVQAGGGKVALIDTEHSFDPQWGTSLGIDITSLPISRPTNAEQGIGVLEALVRQGYDLVGFDSIAAAIPRQHQEVAPGEDTQPGALARVMSKGLARVTAANKQTSVIFINQTRQKIGVTFGSPTTTSGGVAMGFYSSYRLSFTRIGKVTEDVQQWDGEKMAPAKRVIAHRIAATLEKSKLSAPHGDAVFLYDLRTAAVDDVGYLVAQGLERGLIERTTTGRWSIPGVRDEAIHGKDKFMDWMRANQAVVDWLTDEVMPTYVKAGSA